MLKCVKTNFQTFVVLIKKQIWTSIDELIIILNTNFFEYGKFYNFYW